jgi:hypothetical protein
LKSKKKVIQDNANGKIKTVNSENKELAKTVKYSIWEKYFTNYEKVDQIERSEKIKINKIYKIKLKNAVKSKFSQVNTVGKKLENSIKIKKTKLDYCKNEMNKDQADLDLQKSKNEQLNEIKNIINNAYRNSETPEMFIKKINENDIEACINIRENGQGGISFNHLSSDISIAGGKVNSYLTFGKIKKNDPEFFDLLIGNDPHNTITFQQDHRSNLDQSFDIKKINKNYKQKVNFDGSISIFFHKKDAEKYPHNHNIKVSRDCKTISFGQRRNNHDLQLAYEFSKKSGWKNGVSKDKDLVKSLMSLSYKQNKEDLFFFKTKEPTLKMSELKEIIGDETLSIDNLIKLHDENIIIDSEKDKVLIFIKQQLKANNVDMTKVNNLLKKDLSLKEIITEINKPEIKSVDEKEKITIEIKETSKPEITEKSKSEYKSLAEIERDKMRGIK